MKPSTPNNPRAVTKDEMPVFAARKLTAEEVSFDVVIEPETGIAPDFDDPADTAWIQSELEAGNEYAWCWVSVTARWDGFEGRVGIGGCSYPSRHDMEKNLIADLREEALYELNERVAHAAMRIASLL